MISVLDACALISLIKNEDEATIVRQAPEQDGRSLKAGNMIIEATATPLNHKLVHTPA
jgi:uncharacterized protein with PIN domain